MYSTLAAIKDQHILDLESIVRALKKQHAGEVESHYKTLDMVKELRDSLSNLKLHAQGVVDVQEELALAPNVAPGRSMYINRLFRELENAIKGD